MAKFRALMLWTDAWLADTESSHSSERGTYLDLLVLMWRTPVADFPMMTLGSGAICGMTPAEVAAELAADHFRVLSNGREITSGRSVSERSSDGLRENVGSRAITLSVGGIKKKTMRRSKCYAAYALPITEP